MSVLQYRLTPRLEALPSALRIAQECAAAQLPLIAAEFAPAALPVSCLTVTMLIHVQTMRATEQAAA
jgi:hypothetical protein